MTLKERRRRGAKLIEQMLGKNRAEQTRAAWRKISPAFEQYVTEFLAGEIWCRPRLDLRIRSLVTIAALAALGRTLALELNIRMALNNGATAQEVEETLLHIAPYAGFPAAWEGLALAAKVFEEMKPANQPAKRSSQRTP